VAALGARVLRVGDLQRLVVVDVCVDELLRAWPVALLQIEAAGVAKGLLRGWVATP
jgi:hypothetical protein